MTLLFRVADFALTVLGWLLIASALISWFPVDPGNRWVRLLHKITEPILHPIRAIVPSIGGISFDIMIAVGIFYLVQQVLRQASNS